MGQVVFIQVPVKGWIIYTDERGLLDGPGDAMCLPDHNGEPVHIYLVSRGLAIVVDGEWGG